MLGWPHPKVKNGEKIGAIVFLPLRTMLISFLAFKISPDIWKTSLWTSFFEHHLLFTLQQSHEEKYNFLICEPLATLVYIILTAHLQRGEGVYKYVQVCLDLQ